MPSKDRQLEYKLVFLLTIVLTMGATRPVVGQLRSPQRNVTASLGAGGLATLVTRCGGIEPLEESLELVRQHVCSPGRSAEGKILAFEENRWFVYALADMSRGTSSENNDRPQATRRVLLLKPSTLIVEDVVRSPGSESATHWRLRGAAEPRIDGARFRVSARNTEVLGETVLPAGATPEKTALPARNDRPARSFVQVTATQESKEVRFLHVFHLVQNAERNKPTHPLATWNQANMELTVARSDKVVRVTLPADGSAAGKIEITAADGTVAVPNRLLPSSVMPHGPSGAQLMERWDAPYRGEQLPGWDVGRPCSHLVKAVDDKTFQTGRAIVLGCGSGTNAIYLASKGFAATGVDVSPTALAIAAEKAHEAGVKVDWILGDVVALPKLQPYDLVFDRGCYHHICQYDSPGYVETLRRLSHGGSRAMILAGSPADGNSGGPPRIAEETIRRDFSTLFDFVWLQGIHFDSRNPAAQGTSAWSIHLRRKSE